MDRHRRAVAGASAKLAAGALLLWLACAGCTVDHCTSCDDLLAQARTASSQARYDRASELLKQAAKEAALCDDSSKRTRVLREQASASLNKGDAAEAESLAKSLLLIYKEAATHQMSNSKRALLAEDSGRVSMLLSDALVAQKRLAEASKVLNDAFTDMNEHLVESSAMASLDDHRVAVLRGLGKFDEANGHDFDAALDAKYSSKSLNIRGLDLARALRFEEAEASFKSSQKLVQNTTFVEDYILATTYLAMTEFLEKKPEKAGADISQAYDKINHGNTIDPRVQGRVLAVMAINAPTDVLAESAIGEVHRPDEARFAMDILLEVSSILELMRADFSTKKKVLDLGWKLAPQVKADQQMPALHLRSQMYLAYKKSIDEGVAWFRQCSKSQFLADHERTICLGIAKKLNNSR